MCEQQRHPSPDVREPPVACVGQIMANKGGNGQQTGSARSVWFGSDKGRVCFEWQIKDIGERPRVVNSEKWAKRAFAR